jgi:hypothetical protein
MADWRDSQIRYLVHFSDGGSGTRYFDARLVEGDTFSEGDTNYRVRRLDHTSSTEGLSHAWVEPVSPVGRIVRPKAVQDDAVG